MKIRDIQQNVKELQAAQGWQSNSIEQRVMYLVTELGEVVKEVLKLANAGEADRLDDIKENLGLEMFDVIWNLCALANMVEIDLETACAKKIEMNTKRMWEP
jgi:NTP pyrophosphatase (non-canonical NTP hydrolase)